MKLYLSIIIIVISCFGCKKDSKETKSNYAYIGGEIINPNTNFIILTKNEAIIDTIRLDGRNRFLYKVNDLDGGMYTFRHGSEYQMLLLEPNDSILFRLNTLDFDESLVYTGQGDKKNNYLINDFLDIENEENYIVKLCQLEPVNYQKHIDSLKKNKVLALKNFKKKYKTTPLFEKIAQANIDYSYYSSKEVYPFIHYGKNKAQILKSLPADFYNYRKDINYNDTFFNDYFNYNTFLRHNFSNLSLKVHFDHSNDIAFDRSSLCYNLDRLILIDSLVKNTAIKDDLLYYFTINYISKSKNAENNNAILKSYIAKSKSEKGKTMMELYTKSLANLKEGSKLPGIAVLNYDSKEQDINSIINSPTVISFWSHTYYEHFKESHYKLKELKVKYPEVKFITINIDDYRLDKSKNLLAGHGFDSKDEYHFKKPKESTETLAIYPMTKTIIIDKNKKVVNSNTNMFSIHFEEQLLGLINQQL
jgi:hypothetical protein